MGPCEISLPPIDLLPWESDPNEWAICLCPQESTRVWIEHLVLSRVLEGKGLPNTMENAHDVLVQLGGKVSKALRRNPALEVPRMARALHLTKCPGDYRMGFFGGEVWVFLPRAEIEGVIPPGRN